MSSFRRPHRPIRNASSDSVQVRSLYEVVLRKVSPEGRYSRYSYLFRMHKSDAKLTVMNITTMNVPKNHFININPFVDIQALPLPSSCCVCSFRHTRLHLLLPMHLCTTVFSPRITIHTSHGAIKSSTPTPPHTPSSFWFQSSQSLHKVVL